MLKVYVTDDSLRESASNLDDVTLFSELSKVLNICLTSTNFKLREDKKLIPEKMKLTSRLANINSPWMVWARKSIGNYNWVINYANYLLLEYEKRKGATELIKYYRNVLASAMKIDAGEFIKGIRMTPMPNTTTNFKFIADVYEAYRKELIVIWAGKLKSGKQVIWTNNSVPDWFAETEFFKSVCTVLEDLEVVDG